MVRRSTGFSASTFDVPKKGKVKEKKALVHGDHGLSTCGWSAQAVGIHGELRVGEGGEKKETRERKGDVVRAWVS